MSYRYQPPPGWPTPPAGWVPPTGWQPDPTWPPAPVGWLFWVAEPGPPPAPPASASSGSHGHGLFGGGKKAVAEENEQLRAALAQLGALDAVTLAEAIDRQRRELAAVQAQIAEANAQLAALSSEVVETREIALLQAAGIYAYSHPLDNAVAYKDLLARVKADTKTMVSAGNAVLASTSWQVNGSEAQGRVMVRDFSKLLLRAYNAEADNCIRTVKPHSRAAAHDRLTKAAVSIARLGKTMNIRIAEPYHQLRLYEISLTADYLAKVEEEKERNRAERERMRDEEAARRDFEREKQRLAKEQDHVQTAMQRLEAAGDLAGAETMRAKLVELGAAMESVISREANIRMGYVYVISNIGAFGPDMVKIGLTRRRDPMDRIRELGDASVPFLFDVHALVFHEDAVSLETRLHNELADRRVNRVNNRREFFYATPAEIRAKLSAIMGTHLLEYTEEPVAEQWRATQGMAAAPSGRHAAQLV